MEPAFHVWAADSYAAHLKTTPRGRRMLLAAQILLADPAQRPYVDAVGQPPNGWDDGQAAALAQVNKLTTSGRVKVLRVPVGAEPADARDRLAELLPDSFVALVHPRNPDLGDGLLGSRPEAADQVPSPWAGSMHLDIGPADASQTLQRLTDVGHTARWADGGRDVWLFGFPTFTAWHAWRNESFRHALEGDTAAS